VDGAGKALPDKDLTADIISAAMPLAIKHMCSERLPLSCLPEFQ
jgi:hypothetical protein